MAEEQEKSVYHDLDLFGNENTDGSPKYYLEEDAVKNALTSWIGSKKGDYIHNPEIGGILDRFLFKPMNNQIASRMAFTLQNAIINEFVPEITLEELSVIPNYENRLWEIYLKYINPFSNQTESLTIYTKDLTAKESLDYISVLYVGNNLYSFCEIKLPGMSNARILYNEDREKYVWDQYELTNFNSDDPRYEDILILVNGGV
jgi:phage baseplate assembly protein W